MVVLGAIAINTSNFFVKGVAWAYTGSHSMFSEGTPNHPKNSTQSFGAVCLFLFSRQFTA